MTKRSPYAAALMSVAIPGLGHVYVGQARRFLVVLVAIHVVIAVLGLLGAFATFAGAWAYVTLLLLPLPIGIVDSFLAARSGKTDDLRWYNRWYFYLTFIAMVTALVQCHRTVIRPLLGFELFRVIRGDVPPTIARFDFVVVDTRVFARQAPQQGDVVVVRKPDSEVFVGRISRRPSATTFSYIVGSGSEEQTDLPLSTIVGKPTYIFFSRTSGKAGNRIS